MTWIKAKNGVVIDLPDEFAEGLVAQGHEAFNTEDEARGESEPDESGAPRGNASRDEWAAYAASLDIEVPEEAKRADIKALVESAREQS